MRNPVSRFAYVSADLDIKRSQFSRNQDHKTTLSAGYLYPLFVDEVLPGDTYTVDLASLIRMSTPIHPVMDNCFLDTYWFFVPNRIVWDHWKEFMGEVPYDEYADHIDYSVPVLYCNKPTSALNPPIVPFKSILDYLGVPAGTCPKEFNALPVRGFCSIFNNWFMDQNLQNPINIDRSDANLVYASVTNPTDIIGEFWSGNSINPELSDSYVINAAHGGDLPPVNKYHDYFTSALIAPQKGEPVPIPLSGFAPVYATNLVDLAGSGNIPAASTDVRLKNPNSTSLTRLNGNIFANAGLMAGQTNGSIPSGGTNYSAYFNNLGADLSSIAGVYASINDLRSAFQLQKFLEADNRGGSRYREILKNHFGVTSPDATQQIPEFLGGKRIQINMSQVLQTSATNDVSPQGNTAAYSLTTDKYSAFTKSFTEHGFLFCVGCIRTDHTYTQGLEKFWSRKNKFDYYFPEFANISEQPIYNKEIYNGTYREDVSWELAEQIFGFQEAYGDYRYKPNRVSAEFRPTYPESLSIWHYADYYTEQPYLSSDWIRETRSNIDRTLAVNDSSIDQFIADFYFKIKTTRVMPVNSIPGLADHH